MEKPCLHRPLRALACGLALALIPIDASAIFIVTEPWVRVAANARSAEGYMELVRTEGAALIGVRSDVTSEAAIRAPGRTRATVSKIALPAGLTVTLAPGAYRIGLLRLNHPLKLGDRVGMVLTIEMADGSRQDIPVTAEVRLRSPYDDHRRGHKH
jgi:copper(I)-binding protein